MLGDGRLALQCYDDVARTGTYIYTNSYISSSAVMMLAFCNRLNQRYHEEKSVDQYCKLMHALRTI